MPPTDDYLLETRSLTTQFVYADGRVLKAVDNLSVGIRPGQVLGLVGESGSGKSLTALSIMRLLPPRARIVSGDIRFQGRSLLSLSAREMRQIRGRHIAMVLQDPLTALNPLLSIGRHVQNAITAHRSLRGAALTAEVLRMLHLVRLPEPEGLLAARPHELSGGMRQRVVIALALAARAEVIIADEPTTALDVTTQLQILTLFQELCRTTGLSMLFITHDLGVVAHICDEVGVMLRGRLVERAACSALIARPLHTYTQRLLASIPNPRRKGIPLSLPTAGVAEPLRTGNAAQLEQAGYPLPPVEAQLVEVEPGHEVALEPPPTA
jgi:ABC-type dipeptide/oligopeptide/nickel transport system ATPase component